MTPGAISLHVLQLSSVTSPPNRKKRPPFSRTPKSGRPLSVKPPTPDRGRPYRGPTDTPTPAAWHAALTRSRGEDGKDEPLKPTEMGSKASWGVLTLLQRASDPRRASGSGQRGPPQQRPRPQNPILSSSFTACQPNTKSAVAFNMSGFARPRRPGSPLASPLPGTDVHVSQKRLRERERESESVRVSSCEEIPGKRPSNPNT